MAYNNSDLYCKVARRIYKELSSQDRKITSYLSSAKINISSFYQWMGSNEIRKKQVPGFQSRFKLVDLLAKLLNQPVNYKVLSQLAYDHESAVVENYIRGLLEYD